MNNVVSAIVFGLIVIIIAGSLIFGLRTWMNYSSYKFSMKMAKADPWAYGSAEDAIRIIETIRSDPLRSNAESVYQGPNRGSWYISASLIRFRDVRLVYNSFKDYRTVVKWLEKNPAIETASNPSW